MRVLYPAILHPPGNGSAGCAIPGININASGDSDEAALNDAVDMLEAGLLEVHNGGETLPDPLSVDDVRKETDEMGGS